jgi:DNA-binding response OmpR family regulator
MLDNKHILVIEDDYDLLLMLKKLFEINGFKVLTALTAKEGKKKFRKSVKKLNAIILDLSLPDQDGKFICKYIRKKSRQIPIIITTGSEDLMLKIELEKIGVDGFFIKPFDIAALLNSVNSAM